MASRAERIEKAARALGDRIDDMTNDYVGVNEGGTTLVSDSLLRDLIAGANALRAALALPADAAGSAEAVRAACAAVPALEEARRRRLRWADEAHAQILAVPAPAQPAPEGAGEAVAFVPWRVDPQPDVFDDAGEFEWCVETDEARPVLVCTVPSGVMRPQSAPGASHASFATANQIVADHNAMRGRPLPRAEAASVVPAGMECGCCGAKAGRLHSETGCCSRHQDGPRLFSATASAPPATPAERAAAGLEPVDAGLVGQHGELLKAAVAKEAPAQPQVIPGSLRGFPWDADWDKVIDGDAVIYGGRKITFRVEPFRADPHPAPAPADGSAAKFDEAIAAFDRARAEWREAIKQPQVLPEHLAYIEYLASNSCSTEARALSAAVARRDRGAK